MPLFCKSLQSLYIVGLILAMRSGSVFEKWFAGASEVDLVHDGSTRGKNCRLLTATFYDEPIKQQAPLGMQKEVEESMKERHAGG